MSFSQRVQKSDHDEWYYFNNTLSVMTNNNVAGVIFTTNKDFSTNRGIKVGSTLQNVINAYGSNYEILENGDFNMYVYNVKIEGNIIDRVSNFFQSKESKIGNIVFIVNKQSQKVEGFSGLLVNFTQRDDSSLVVFKKDSAREIDRYYANGGKLIVFQGYEFEPNGYFQMYNYYGVFYNKSEKLYKVIYPKTMNFPGGQRFTIKNDYQIKVCNVMIKFLKSRVKN